MQSKIFILVYGSLREGEYNYLRLLATYPKGLKRVATYRLPGYKMYSLSYYPCCIHTGKEEQEVTFELMEVSAECYDAIEQMENGAGYDTNVVDIETKIGGIETIVKATVFLYVEDEKTLDGRYDIVEKGDWLYFTTPPVYLGEEEY